MRSSRCLIPLAALIIALHAPAALPSEGEVYEEIRVLLPSDSSLRELLKGSDLELMGLGDGDVRLLSRPSITRRLLDEGWHVEVIQPDLESFYASRQAGKRDYGVWHTYAETVAELNLLHSQYPNLTTAPFSLGLSIEGREIWAIKVSDNPNVDEDEPEVLHDGVHHAREIMTVEMCLYFPRYLCENYGTDPLATFLVDNREIYFVPIMNPDGFVYNETTNPNGGGMWRKNRRVNQGSSCRGVDPNRNYPYEWGGGGSSGDPCDETYRGTAPASEPENQAMINLINGREFVTHDTWHSVAGMILFPWGYTLNHTPDDATFRAIASERARYNGYQTGQPPEILYEVNGGFFDWTYGEQTTKPKIFSFCTEFGGSGFWPAQSEREGLLAENLYSALYLTQIAGPVVSTTGLAVSGGNGNGQIEPGETVDLLATIHNSGVVANATSVSIRLLCDDPYIVLLDASNGVGTLTPGQSWTNTADPFSVRADATCPQGRLVTFTVVADADGGVHSETPFVLTIGVPPVLVANDFENAGEEWSQDPSHTATTGAWVRIDPVATSYQPGDDTTPAPGIYAMITAQNPSGQNGVDDVDGGIAAMRSPDFNLSAYASVRVSMMYFHGQRDTGGDAGDFFKIDASSNGGGSWVNLLTLGDVASSATWRSFTADLEDYIPLTNQVRFRVQAADGTTVGEIIEGGIDDFYLYNAGTGNEPPSSPTLVSPADGATNVPASAILKIGNANDPESDPLTYGFRIYSDGDLTQIVRSIDGVPQGAGGQTSWAVTPPLSMGTYHWRAYAADPEQRGLYMEAASFTVNEQVGAEDLSLPAEAELLVGPNPVRDRMVIRTFVPATLTSRLGVYDAQGRLIRSLEHVPSAAGWQEAEWDSRDDVGRPVPSGTYWVRLWTPGMTRTVRVVSIE